MTPRPVSDAEAIGRLGVDGEELHVVAEAQLRVRLKRTPRGIHPGAQGRLGTGVELVKDVVLIGVAESATESS